MEIKKRFEKTKVSDNGRKEVFCESCGCIQHTWSSQTILPNDKWNEISKNTGCNLLCNDCIEEYLGRPVTLDDLKWYDDKKTIMIPANFWICKKLDDGRGLRYFTWEEFDEHFNENPNNRNFSYKKSLWESIVKMKNSIFDEDERI